MRAIRARDMSIYPKMKRASIVRGGQGAGLIARKSQ